MALRRKPESSLFVLRLNNLDAGWSLSSEVEGRMTKICGAFRSGKFTLTTFQDLTPRVD